MPLQNRVNPLGQLIAHSSRGTLMGNRGCLHDDSKTVRKTFARKAWVTCQLRWKGIKRQVFAPGRYSELFFLDEATALAAGHRPCNDCRREELRAFKSLWERTQNGGSFIKAEAMDAQIHLERTRPDRTKKMFRAKLGTLADGVMILSPKDGTTPLLIWKGQLLSWSFDGYSSAIILPENHDVDVLTPCSVCDVIAAGYKKAVHPSADRLAG